MSMNKADMAKALIDGMKDKDKPADAMKAFGDALKKYIEDNCEIKYSWAATLPPPTPTPDSKVSFTSGVKFPAFVLSSPPSMLAFGPILTGAIAGGLIKHPAEFLVPPGAFLPIPIMVTQSKKDKQKDAMEYLANEIINGMKKMINPAPLPGAHPPYVVPTPGAIMTSIA